MNSKPKDSSVFLDQCCENKAPVFDLFLCVCVCVFYVSEMLCFIELCYVEQNPKLQRLNISSKKTHGIYHPHVLLVGRTEDGRVTGK